MDFTISMVDLYTSFSQQNTAQQVELSSMKRAIENFEVQSEELINAVNTVNIVTPEHIDVSI